MSICIQIARSDAFVVRGADQVETFEVRVIGPGGWRTSISRASLSACRSDADAWATVLGIDVVEEDQ